MASRQRPPPAAPSRSAGYATPTRRPATASPSSSLSRPGSAAPRTPLSSLRRVNGTPTPSTVRRKQRPQWNEYLTDGTQYRLTQERQLVRHMQQLSAAHFHARSPARRRELASDGSPSTDSSSDRLESDYSEIPTHEARDPIQGELSRLEGMLSDLEQESAYLQEPDDDDGVGEVIEEGYDQSGYARRDHNGEVYANHCGSMVEEKGQHSGDVHTEEESHGDDEEEDPSTVGVEDTVSSICFKSLRIGIDLTKKMQQLARELDHERRHRKKHERRIVELEQQYQAAETRCRIVEAQYEDVSSQLDGMRDAMIATEEAIHRLTQELLRSRQFGSTSQQRPPKSPPPQRQKRPEIATSRAKFFTQAVSNDESQANDKENRHVTFASAHQGGHLEWSS